LRTCWRASEATAWFLAALAGAGLALALSSCGGFDHLTRVQSSIPLSKDCAACHVDIAREWTASPHAAAWSSADFRAASNGYRFSACLPCHAPEPAWSSRTPSVARAGGRQEGVTCVSCHLEPATAESPAAMAGPLPPTGMVSPHPVTVRPERYRDAAFCGRCHEGTYRQWRQAAQADKPPCQQCHMPAIRRKMTQSTGGISGLLVAMEKAEMERRHTFDPLPRSLEAPPVALSARRQDEQIEMVLHNRLPHAIPTGEFGFRVCVLRVGDESGPLAQQELSAHGGTALPAGGELRWRLDRRDPGAWPARLRVRLAKLHPDGRASEWFVLEVPVP